MGKDSKPKEASGKGKGKQAGGSDEAKGKGKSGKSSDGLGTCTYVKGVFANGFNHMNLNYLAFLVSCLIRQCWILVLAVLIWTWRNILNAL